MSRKDVLKIASHYGYEAQTRQLIEEMAELTKALNKDWRKNVLADDFDYSLKLDVVEEIADVQIMLWQMEAFFPVENLDHVIKEKINRQLKRMEERRSGNN